MTSKHYKRRRYAVQARRKDTAERWSEWTAVDDYDDAVKHRNRAAELGYCARIVDKREREMNKHGLDKIY